MKLIELIDIEKNYFLGTHTVYALQKINLDVLPNEYLAIMGPSGSGKSTLMNILGCLDSLSSGQYILNGKDVSNMTDNQLAEVRNKEIGFVFQSFNLLSRYNAFENVMLPLIYAGIPSKRRIELTNKALKDVDLTNRSNHKPNELSGGQRQRVAIARAIVNNPSIILADEPTGNLDTKTSIEIMSLFAEIHNKGNTVILVTHEDDIAKYARRTIKLRDGKIESDNINLK